MGIGVLYGREPILEKTKPLLFGGDMISNVSFTKSHWNELPWKLEAGTPDVGGAVGFSAAVCYLKKIGMETVLEHEKNLAVSAMKCLSDVEGLRIFGPKKRAGLVSFDIKGVHPHDVSALLDAEGIAVRGGHHCAMPLSNLLGVSGTTRASFYVYNTTEEISKLRAAIEKIKRKLKP
jgi:cysteine desulfurase / selenocysteine lyase